MIDFLRWVAGFCFWLIIASVLLTLCAIGLWVTVNVIRELRKRK